jgi:HEPN domain-containing protein
MAWCCMSDATDPRSWIERAEEDYAAVLSAVRRQRPLTYIASFHAQQCAEKYLKAILVSRQVPFSRTHDLLLLNDLCDRAGVLLGLDGQRLNTLSDHAVKARYPGDDPTPEEAREALEIAKTVRRFARIFLGL